MKLHRILFMLLPLLLVAAPMFSTATACVGKTLVVGAAGDEEQAVLAEILSLLITERTGTSIKVVKLDSSADAHRALLDDKVDMYVEYTGNAQLNILNAAPVADAKELYTAVKKRYQKELNLIWLKPLGFSAVDSSITDLPVEAATVIRKDVLKKFPALQRLIDKLAGQIDNQVVAQLVAKAKENPARTVAKEFLKKKRFI